MTRRVTRGTRVAAGDAAGAALDVVFRCPPELDGLLPRPVPARRGLPDWLKAMPMTAPSEDAGGPVRTVKQCPPLIDAMSSGFLIPLATDLRIEEGRFSWDWPLPPSSVGRYTRSPIAFHLNDQAVGTPLYEADRALIKFNNFWAIELPPGYSLLATHPFNREELPFRTLTGLVDADLYKDAFIQFPARWRDPSYTGVLPAGTPIAQCIPVRRTALALRFESLEGEAAARFVETKEAVNAEPGVYRRRFRAHKP